MKNANLYSNITSISVISIALLCSTQAWSQSTAPQSADAVPAPGAVSAEEAAQDGGGLQDIVVTAQKRAQNVQDVPIAISAILGTQLAKAGVVTTEDLKVSFAGVNIKTTSSQFQPSIRGVGTATSNVENAVALYIDGVYYANQSDGRRELNDIEQVAVLKGPQGTLFGRNATAGVIQMTTRAPSFDWSGEVTANVDNYATVRTGLYLTGGLTDTLAVSLSGNFTKQGDGWGKNYTTGKDTYKIDHIASIRGKLLFRPGSDTDITLIGDYIDREDNLGAYLRAFPGTSVNPEVPYVEPPTVYDSYADVDALNLYKGGGASATINHQFGFAKFQSITAYRKFRTGYIVDGDMTRITGYKLDTSHNEAESFSQEVQLTSGTDSAINWAVGAFYFHYENGLHPVRRTFGGPHYVPSATSVVERTLYSTETVNSLAPFAQADFEILPRTRLTLGARWTYEKRSLDANQSALRADGSVVNSTVRGSITAKKPTWRIALDHKFSDDILGYISYNRGFKSGGYNLSNIANPSYKPEELDAYETGLKTTLLGRKLRLNIAGFYYKYKNLQVLQLVSGAPTITNGANAELYGLDADFDASLTSELRLNGSVELLHSEFTRYPGAAISFTPAGGGVSTRFGDVSGNRLPLAQNFTGNLALDYTKDLAFGEINLNAAVSYNGNFAFDPDNIVKQKGYTNINLAANWISPSKAFSLGLYLRNLLDNKVISYSTASSGLGYITSYDNPPRIYGVSARYKF